jgi:hypothetical protein
MVAVFFNVVTDTPHAHVWVDGAGYKVLYFASSAALGFDVLGNMKKVNFTQEMRPVNAYQTSWHFI